MDEQLRRDQIAGSAAAAAYAKAVMDEEIRRARAVEGRHIIVTAEWHARLCYGYADSVLSKERRNQEAGNGKA